MTAAKAAAAETIGLGLPDLPERSPFALRARLLTPLDAGGTRHEPDAIVEVDPAGRLAWVGPTDAWTAERAGASVPADHTGPAAVQGPRPTPIDVRPWVVMPGLVDLHAHLPQLPNAGLGAGLDLLTWLETYIFPLEREFSAEVASRVAPLAFEAFARAGTTTIVAYGAVYEASLEAAFQAAEAHGIRAVIGKVMMDRIRYDPTISDAVVLEQSLREASDLCSRWHGRDDGRLLYAFTPRFAVSCTAEMLRESASLARSARAYWQTHLSEDRGEIEEVGRLFPEASDYLDVYDRAGGLGERTILAHAIHLSDREVARIVESGSRVAHCPASNLFLASGVMPLARYLEAGMVVGLGSDVAAGPDVSIVGAMRVGAYVQSALRVVRGDPQPTLTPLDWLRMGTLEGARALGLEASIGSIERGKEADLLLVDADRTAPLPGVPADDPAELMSRLIYRAHSDMVRGAWVRGRRLAGPS
jgi:guanine deaminase